MPRSARSRHPRKSYSAYGTTVHVDEIAHHRNGIAGEPFYVVKFQDSAMPERKMVGVVFKKKYETAVFDRRELGKGNIAFAEGNSWRGDHYDEPLRAAIQEQEGEEGW